MQLASILGVLTLLVTIITAYFPIRSGIRRDRATRLAQAREEEQQRIEAAVKPYRDRETEAHARVAELQAAELTMVEAAVQPWRDRVADRDREIENVRDELAYWRNLANNRPVPLTKPEDPHAPQSQ